MVRASLALVLVLLLLPAPVSAATRTEILRDCQDGSLSGTYTRAELRDARSNIPADIDQYSDCRDVLARALTAPSATDGGNDGNGDGSATGGGGSPTGGATPSNAGTGGSVPTAPSAPVRPNNPTEEQALAEAAKEPEPVTVGQRPVVPGASAFSPGVPQHALPSSLVVTLVLLAVAALGGAAPLVRRRVLDRRNA
ncbi:MAG TPA: hypothetical protein VN213_01100 [Solirubrobacteraceae bacterium]|nr:hypothetical protein [Solirubrobacteraceae bacterium]